MHNIMDKTEFGDLILGIVVAATFIVLVEIFGGCIHMMSSLLGIHCSDGREHVATLSPTRTRSVSQE